MANAQAAAYTQWSVRQPFVVWDGFHASFLMAWGKLPMCGVCGQPIRCGQVARWQLRPKALCHARCLAEDRRGRVPLVHGTPKSGAALPRASHHS